MLSFFCCICFCAFIYHSPDEFQDFDARRATGLTSAQIADGWLSLFDGQTLFGWRQEVEADFKISEGSIFVSKGKVGLLRTAAQFDDFELRLEFMSDTDANGGVFIRTNPSPENPVTDCYEVNIAPSANPFPTGSIVGKENASANVRTSRWNQMTIRADGPRIQVWINGQPVIDFSDSGSFLQKGYIGLQHNSGRVGYRNIVLKPLNVDQIFNGSNLDGWSDTQKRDSRFVAQEHGILRMTGGSGQLESAERFGNFIFSAQIKTNAVGLNSGIFFRCIPGEYMNGYESQIQNQFASGDRASPVDFGTGGIFRRQRARYVNSADQKWLAKTIVADGATICVWVNGYQVVDWTDKRKRHENPRRGLRLKSGTIILQGHDPKTDLNFRQIRARELKSRRN